MWTYDQLQELKSDIDNLASDYPFLAQAAAELSRLVGDAMVDATPGEDDEDEVGDSPDPGGDGFVTLGRNDWEVRLEGIERGRYPKYEMAVYQLARVMAETGSFPACWAEGEHGPSSRLIDDEVRAFHDAGGDGLLPLPGARFAPGDLVIDTDGGWPCQVIFDYGTAIGVHVHAQGDPDVTMIVPPARLVAEGKPLI